MTFLKKRKCYIAGGIMGRLRIISRPRRLEVTSHDKSLSGRNEIKLPLGKAASSLIKRDFSSAEPDRLWTSDITYIWTQEGWLYPAVILDTYCRRIVGWAMSHRISDHLFIDAFRQARCHRRPLPGLIGHSDRGSQHCSRFFKELLKTHGYRQSMSSTGNCYDNAITESFFAKLKTELIYHERYRSRNEARRSIFKYIEMFYNRQRIHSARGGLSPFQYEQMKIAA